MPGEIHGRLAQAMVLVIFIYLMLALRRVYAEGRLRTFAKGVPLFAALLAIEMALAFAAINLAERGPTH